MQALAKRMGKVPVVVKDGPGFLVNRIQVAMYREILDLLEQGVASAEDIDFPGFDPLSGEGELRVESVTIYQLPN